MVLVVRRWLGGIKKVHPTGRAKFGVIDFKQ
jgi:hypothetical protein